MMRRKPWSLLVTLAVLLGVVVWRYRLEVMTLMPPCSFRLVTGWHCPGCGGRRSVAALGRGEILTALRMNLLIYPLALLLAGLFFQLVRNEWTCGVREPVDVSSRTAWLIAIAVVGFWVLRNVPYWPFRLLAPF